MSKKTTVGQARSRKSKHAAKKHISPKSEPGTDTEQEQVLMFLIGLRLLGETKQKKFLEYMATLKENTGDTTNGIHHSPTRPETNNVSNERIA